MGFFICCLWDEVGDAKVERSVSMQALQFQVLAKSCLECCYLLFKVACLEREEQENLLGSGTTYTEIQITALFQRLFLDASRPSTLRDFIYALYLQLFVRKHGVQCLYIPQFPLYISLVLIIKKKLLLLTKKIKQLTTRHLFGPLEVTLQQVSQFDIKIIFIFFLI